MKKMSQDKSNLILYEEMEIVKITEDLYDAAIELFQEHFMKYECVCIAANLRSSQSTIDELLLLVREALKDGISFAVRDQKTMELVAMSINKMVAPKAGCTLDEVLANFQTKQMKYVSVYLEQMENTINIFDKWGIDCVFEILFLCTHVNYGGKGLAVAVAQHSIKYAQQILQESLPKDEILKDHLKDLKPKAVCAVFTGHYSQRVGEKLGFETIYKVPNQDFVFEGKTFYEKLDPIHKYSTFAAKLL